MMPRRTESVPSSRDGPVQIVPVLSVIFFLLINTLLECTLVGAWIAIFQKTVVSRFFFTVREKTKEVKNLM